METESLIEKSGAHKCAKKFKWIKICVIIVAMMPLAFVLVLFFDILNFPSDDTESNWTLQNNIILPSQSFKIEYYANISSMIEQKYNIPISEQNFQIQHLQYGEYINNISIIYLSSISTEKYDAVYLFALIDFDSDALIDDIKIIKTLDKNLIRTTQDGFNAILLDNKKLHLLEMRKCPSANIGFN